MTAFVSIFFIGQRDKIDDESFRFMLSLSKKPIIQPWLIMLCVLGSLELEQHFMLYPTLMTLLIMRFAYLPNTSLRVLSAMAAAWAISS